MKDPDFEGWQFLPPNEERRLQRKKRSSTFTFKLVLVIAGLPLVAGSISAEELVSCPELGPVLGTFNSWDFLHMEQKPQCKENIMPEMTLYTRKNESQNCLLIQKDSRNVFSDYDISSECVAQLQDLEKVVFLVHGFTLLGSDLGQYEKMKTEIIQDRSTGVIIVDWIEGSKIDVSHLQDRGVVSILLDFVNLGPYQQAAANTRYIGAAMAMVTANIRKVMSQDPFMHCIGHSLGAHACGFLGKALLKLSADPLGRITGLDPAGPLFLESDIFSREGVPGSPSTRLTPEDAILVDTIHTDSTWLGSFTKTGHIDFYIGQQQSGTDMFGYNQPAAVDCFIGSHSLSKDMFLATIQEECFVQNVCSNINLNLLDNCRPVERVKFGYNIDHPIITQGSFPVTTDEHTLRCQADKRIKYESSLPNLLMKTLSDFKGACPLVQFFLKSILHPLQKLKELLDSNIEKTIERKLSVDATLEKLMSLGSEHFSEQDDLLKMHQDLLKVDDAYEGHKMALKNLATRTTRQTTRIISDLKDIQDPKKQNNGDNIKDMLNRMKDLMNYSNQTLTKADQYLEKADKKYAEVISQLDVAKYRIDSFKRNVDAQTRQNNAETKALKMNINTGALLTTALSLSIASLAVALAPLALPWAIEVEAAMVACGAPTSLISLLYAGKESYEIETEASMLKSMEAWKKSLKSLEDLTSEYSVKMFQFQEKIKEKRKDVKERLNIVSVWSELIDYKYKTDDYKKTGGCNDEEQQERN